MNRKIVTMLLSMLANLMMYNALLNSNTATVVSCGTQVLYSAARATVYANDTVGNIGYSGTIYFALQASALDTTPPTISILSPQNKTYATTYISLTFTVDESVTWIGYSTDGRANVAITGNTTLFGLSDGWHNLIVYASDTAGNIGASEMVYFRIDTNPPTISILSPENTTYPVTSTNAVPLTFTVNEITSWIGYSFYGQANMTITGNTTLSGLVDGTHSIVVYAKDTAGNTGTSEIIYFTVETKQEPFPALIMAAIVIIVAIVAVVIVYFIKFRSSNTTSSHTPQKDMRVKQDEADT